MLIFISNMCGDHNKGDLAIIEATHDSLNEYFPDADIVIQNVDYSLSTVKERGLNRWSNRLAIRYHGSFFPRVSERKNSFISKIGSVVKSLLLSLYLFILACIAKVVQRPLSRFVPANHRQAWQDLLDSDLVVAKGGCYLLRTIHSPIKDTLFLYRMTFVFLLARILGKKVVFLGHSIGPVVGAVRRGLVRAALKGAYAIVIRETLSRQYVENELGIDSKKIHLCPDMAFWFCGKPLESKGFTGMSLDRERDHLRYIGLTVREWSFPETSKGNLLMEKYVDDMVDFLSRFIDIHLECSFVLLPHCLEDLNLSQHIADKVKSRRVMVFTDDLSTNELRYLMSKLDCLIGTRIHSNILALTVGTPVIPIIYEVHKGIGIMRMAGVPKKCHFFIQEIDTKSLARSLEKILYGEEGLESRRARIIATVRKLKDEIDENLAKVLGGGG